MKMSIDITEQEIKELKTVRNYFCEHDTTTFEHKAYAILNSLLRKFEVEPIIPKPDVSCRSCAHWEASFPNEPCDRCDTNFSEWKKKETK